MPSYTRGKPRDVLTFVRMGAASPLYYGFKTKDLANISGVTASDLVDCGHLTVSQVPASGAILILGANSPKPPRVKKRISTISAANVQASVSTFCAPASLGAAAAAGFLLAKPGRGVKITPDGRSVSAAAKPSATGGLYVFPMNKDDYTAYAADLGLEIPNSAAERAQCYTGTSSPRPAILKKTVTTAGGAIATVSSFCSYDALDAATTAGWEIVREATQGLGGGA